MPANVFRSSIASEEDEECVLRVCVADDVVVVSFTAAASGCVPEFGDQYGAAAADGSAGDGVSGGEVPGGAEQVCDGDSARTELEEDLARDVRHSGGSRSRIRHREFVLQEKSSA